MTTKLIVYLLFCGLFTIQTLGHMNSDPAPGRSPGPPTTQQQSVLLTKITAIQRHEDDDVNVNNSSNNNKKNNNNNRNNNKTDINDYEQNADTNDHVQLQRYYESNNYSEINDTKNNNNNNNKYNEHKKIKTYDESAIKQNLHVFTQNSQQSNSDIQKNLHTPPDTFIGSDLKVGGVFNNAAAIAAAAATSPLHENKLYATTKATTSPHIVAAASSSSSSATSAPAATCNDNLSDFLNDVIVVDEYEPLNSENDTQQHPLLEHGFNIQLKLEHELFDTATNGINCGLMYKVRLFTNMPPSSSENTFTTQSASEQNFHTTSAHYSGEFLVETFSSLDGQERGSFVGHALGNKSPNAWFSSLHRSSNDGVSNVPIKLFPNSKTTTATKYEFNSVTTSEEYNDYDQQQPNGRPEGFRTQSYQQQTWRHADTSRKYSENLKNGQAHNEKSCRENIWHDIAKSHASAASTIDNLNGNGGGESTESINFWLLNELCNLDDTIEFRVFFRATIRKSNTENAASDAALNPSANDASIETQQLLHKKTFKFRLQKDCQILLREATMGTLDYTMLPLYVNDCTVHFPSYQNQHQQQRTITAIGHTAPGILVELHRLNVPCVSGGYLRFSNRSSLCGKLEELHDSDRMYHFDVRSLTSVRFFKNPMFSLSFKLVDSCYNVSSSNQSAEFYVQPTRYDSLECYFRIHLPYGNRIWLQMVANNVSNIMTAADNLNRMESYSNGVGGKIIANTFAVYTQTLQAIDTQVVNLTTSGNVYAATATAIRPAPKVNKWGNNDKLASSNLNITNKNKLNRKPLSFTNTPFVYLNAANARQQQQQQLMQQPLNSATMSAAAKCAGVIIKVFENDFAKWSYCVESGQSMRAFVLESTGNTLSVHFFRAAQSTIKKSATTTQATVVGGSLPTVYLSYAARPVAEIVSNCAFGWIAVQQFCVSVIEQSMRWHDAEQHCVGLGGHMASIRTDMQQEIINKMLHNSPGYQDHNAYWIGGSDKSYEGDFRWSDGLLFQFTNWFPGWIQHGHYNRQPNDDGLSNQDCIELRRYFRTPPGVQANGNPLTNGFLWNDRDCNARNYFICERPMSDETFRRNWINDCNKTVSLTKEHPRASVWSPSFPRQYPDNANCFTTVTAPAGYRIVIEFEELVIENEPGCTYDYLEIIEPTHTDYVRYAKSSKHKTVKINSINTNSNNNYINNNNNENLNENIYNNNNSNDNDNDNEKNSNNKTFRKRNSYENPSLSSYTPMSTSTTTTLTSNSNDNKDDSSNNINANDSDNYLYSNNFNNYNLAQSNYGKFLNIIFSLYKPHTNFIIQTPDYPKGNPHYNHQHHHHHNNNNNQMNADNEDEEEQLPKRLCGDWSSKLKLLRHISAGSYLGLHFVSDYSHHFGGYKAKAYMENTASECANERLKSYNGSCYLFVSYPEVDWWTAQQICRGMNAKLSSVSTSDEHRFITSNIRNQIDYSPQLIYWLGAELEKNGQFEWTDDTKMSFQGWLPGQGQFDSLPSDATCLGLQWKMSPTPMLPSGLYWQSQKCNKIGGYVCKKPKESSGKHSINNFTITGNEGRLLSPAYPNTYPLNLDYWIHIKSPERTRIVIQFQKIDLEPQDECLYDFVSIEDYELVTRITLEPGTNPIPMAMLSSDEFMMADGPNDSDVDSEVEVDGNENNNDDEGDNSKIQKTFTERRTHRFLRRKRSTMTMMARRKVSAARTAKNQMKRQKLKHRTNELNLMTQSEFQMSRKIRAAEKIRKLKKNTTPSATVAAAAAGLKLTSNNMQSKRARTNGQNMQANFLGHNNNENHNNNKKNNKNPNIEKVNNRNYNYNKVKKHKNIGDNDKNSKYENPKHRRRKKFGQEIDNKFHQNVLAPDHEKYLLPEVQHRRQRRSTNVINKINNNNNNHHQVDDDLVENDDDEVDDVDALHKETTPYTAWAGYGHFDFVDNAQTFLPYVRWCGSHDSNMSKFDFVSSSNQVMINFHSDYSTTGLGFAAIWKAVDISGCPIQTLTSREGNVFSPNYPHFLLNNLNCAYIIQAPIGRRVWLEFLDYNLHSDAIVEVDIGDGAFRPFKFRNHANEGIFVSLREQLRVQFRTGQHPRGKGFQAIYHTVGQLERRERVINLTSNATGYLFQLNFPHDMPENVDFTQHLFAPFGDNILLELHGVEFTENGCPDNNLLEIYDNYADNNGTKWQLCKFQNAQNLENLYGGVSSFGSTPWHTETYGYQEQQQPLNQYERLTSSVAFNGRRRFQRQQTSAAPPVYITSYLNTLHIRQRTTNKSVANLNATVRIQWDNNYKMKLAMGDKTVESCQPNPCQFNGKCITNNNGSSYCQCHGHYTGRFCGLNLCELEPCVFGKCELILTNFKCQCQPGYMGTTCEQKQRPCAENPCEGRGICLEKNGGYFCRCHAWWEGHRCERRMLHIPYKPLSERMLQEPFWLGLITVFVVLAVIGLVWCAKRHFPEKIEKLLAEEADRNRPPGSIHGHHHHTSLREQLQFTTAIPQTTVNNAPGASRSIFNRLGIRKPSLLSLSSPNPIPAGGGAAARTFSLDDLLRPPPRRSPSPRKKRNNSTPVKKNAAEKKQILQQLVSPAAIQGKPKVSLGELISMSENRLRINNVGSESDLKETTFSENSGSLTSTTVARTIADPKLEKKVTFARLLNKVSAEMSSGCEFDIGQMAGTRNSSALSLPTDIQYRASSMPPSPCTNDIRSPHSTSSNQCSDSFSSSDLALTDFGLRSMQNSSIEMNGNGKHHHIGGLPFNVVPTTRGRHIGAGARPKVSSADSILAMLRNFASASTNSYPNSIPTSVFVSPSTTPTASSPQDDVLGDDESSTSSMHTPVSFSSGAPDSPIFYRQTKIEVPVLDVLNAHKNTSPSSSTTSSSSTNLLHPPSILLEIPNNGINKCLSPIREMPTPIPSPALTPIMSRSQRSNSPIFQEHPLSTGDYSDEDDKTDDSEPSDTQLSEQIFLGLKKDRSLRLLDSDVETTPTDTTTTSTADIGKQQVTYKLPVFRLTPAAGSPTAAKPPPPPLLPMITIDVEPPTPEDRTPTRPRDLIIPTLTVEQPSPTKNRHPLINFPGSPPPQRASIGETSFMFPNKQQQKRLLKQFEKPTSLDFPFAPPTITVTANMSEMESDTEPLSPASKTVTTGGLAPPNPVGMCYLSPFTMCSRADRTISESNLSSSGYSSMASPGPSRCGSSNPLCPNEMDESGSGHSGAGLSLHISLMNRRKSSTLASCKENVTNGDGSTSGSNTDQLQTHRPRSDSETFSDDILIESNDEGIGTDHVDEKLDETRLHGGRFKELDIFMEDQVLIEVEEPPPPLPLPPPPIVVSNSTVNTGAVSQMSQLQLPSIVIQMDGIEKGLSPVSSRSESPLSERASIGRFAPHFYGRKDQLPFTDSDGLYDFPSSDGKGTSAQSYTHQRRSSSKKRERKSSKCSITQSPTKQQLELASKDLLNTPTTSTSSHHVCNKHCHSHHHPCPAASVSTRKSPKRRLMNRLPIATSSSSSESLTSTKDISVRPLPRRLNSPNREKRPRKQQESLSEDEVADALLRRIAPSVVKEEAPTKPKSKIHRLRAIGNQIRFLRRLEKSIKTRERIASTTDSCPEENTDDMDSPQATSPLLQPTSPIKARLALCRQKRLSGGTYGITTAALKGMDRSLMADDLNSD